MFKKLFKKIAYKIYLTGKYLDEENRYSSFRSQFKIDSSFRFNGNEILFYGNGTIICKGDSYIGSYSTIQAYDSFKVEIGKGCAISHNVRIYTQSYEADQDLSQEPVKIKIGDVIIGDYVWIGANVFINPGITIGNNAVIGANSVVTKNVGAYSIVGGVPAKVIRQKNIPDVS
jgi:maltose O-acetyltransferase